MADPRISWLAARESQFVDVRMVCLIFKMEFRDGNPDDFIAFSTKNNYIQHNWDDPIIKEIMGFLISQEALRKYVLFGEFSKWGKSKQKFWSLREWGPMASQKSLSCLNWLLHTMPKNCPFHSWRKRGDSGNATPELAQKRIDLPDARTWSTHQDQCGFDEGAYGWWSHYGKSLGWNAIWVQTPIQDGVDLQSPSDSPHDDEGTWRRIRSVQFQSKSQMQRR